MNERQVPLELGASHDEPPKLPMEPGTAERSRRRSVAGGARGLRSEDAVSEKVDRLRHFLRTHHALMEGDEISESQTFVDRLMEAFGHANHKAAGGKLEKRTRGRKGTVERRDFLYPGRVMLEMKSRGVRLARFQAELLDRWIYEVPNRPKYAVLCDFDEFWIYDFNRELQRPVDIVRVADLPDRYAALNFLFEANDDPVFDFNREPVTGEAAAAMGDLLRRLTAPDRGVGPDVARRFILQSVLAMFAQCFDDLLPLGLFKRTLERCDGGVGSGKAVGDLFRRMNVGDPDDGRSDRVPKFNGSLFDTVVDVELQPSEYSLLTEAASKDWRRVAPPVFGSLFQESMDTGKRREDGAHYTAEAEIQHVIEPTLVRPLRAEIERAKKLSELKNVGERLRSVRVLDPACGSGNFLYAAYRALVRLEAELIEKVQSSDFAARSKRSFGRTTAVSLRQMFGVDKDPFAVELSKVTLMLGKRLALEEFYGEDGAGAGLGLSADDLLPLENLGENFVVGDAPFCKWPEAEFIVGNPPFISKVHMQRAVGRTIIDRLAEEYPGVPGKSNYCVYWFRKAHDHLPDGGRAGLIGTSTIRQGDSRSGGLDHIDRNGGAITQAVAVQAWPGDADVSVSVVNWVKGDAPGKKKLLKQLGDSPDSPWVATEHDRIGPSLSEGFDSFTAARLDCNKKPKVTFQGQTAGLSNLVGGKDGPGFLISPALAEEMIADDPRNRDVLFWCLGGDELTGDTPPAPNCCVIDFGGRNLLAAKSYRMPFLHCAPASEEDRRPKAEEERRNNTAALSNNPDANIRRHHQGFYDRYWQLKYRRADLVARLNGMRRYVACSRTMKQPVFEFVDASIRPADALQVFLLEDDYSFGVLQSDTHWQWTQANRSSRSVRTLYASGKIFDTLPWPQHPTPDEVRRVASAARRFREERRSASQKFGMTFSECHGHLEEKTVGKDPLHDAKRELDGAVRDAYSMPASADQVEFLFKLNQNICSADRASVPCRPGLPQGLSDRTDLFSEDRIVAHPL